MTTGHIGSLRTQCVLDIFLHSDYSFISFISTPTTILEWRTDHQSLYLFLLLRRTTRRVARTKTSFGLETAIALFIQIPPRIYGAMLSRKERQRDVVKFVAFLVPLIIHMIWVYVADRRRLMISMCLDGRAAAPPAATTTTAISASGHQERSSEGDSGLWLRLLLFIFWSMVVGGGEPSFS